MAVIHSKHLLVAMFIGTFALFLFSYGTGTAGAKVPDFDFTAKQPILITSSGQSMDVLTVKVLCDRLKLNPTYDPQVQAEKLKEFKALIITAGASQKGFGAAGINAETELVRTKKLYEEAHKIKLAIVGVHIGGPERRGPTSVPFVELLAKNADILVVWEKSNADGYFTRIAKERKIQCVVIPQVLDLSGVLQKIFTR